MATVTVTAASIGIGPTVEFARAIAGGTITAGQPLYRASDGHYERADAGSAATAIADRISLHSAADGQGILCLTAGDMYFGSGALTAEADYFVGSSAGAIVTKDELGSGDRIVYIGTAVSTSILRVNFVDTGIVKA